MPQIEDPQDILIVKNIDEGCDEQSEEPRIRYRTVLNAMNQPVNIAEDYIDSWNHKDFFQVRYSGHPHRILPGETRKMPRYVAEHYAKHLADHMLQKLAKETNRPGLMTSPTERPKMIARILIGVDTYYLGEGDMDEGAKIASQVDQMNITPEEEAKAVDIGPVPNPAVGQLTPEPKPLAEVMKTAGESEGDENPKPQASVEVAKAMGNGEPANQPATPSIWNEDNPKPSKKELLKTAYDLGLNPTGKENVDQLIGMVKKF